MYSEDEYYDDFDVENSYYPDTIDWEFEEILIKKVVARQGPDYIKYKSCMWE